ncbi:MAG TPA: cell division protein ZapA [Vitreimonas sp.]|uniref:cell division protein ZapA n=1 Tax=Vitreimonas sp. TaxID=3069702 RepID=UPI002D4177EC|nr:cell division protein ZapA [Vitreimonas sp.]HYD87912.1 cell division protein ZapA [Vitreimonas sp.]
MQTNVTILGRQFTIECGEGDCRRLEDLARALDARLAHFAGDDAHRLVLAALSLLDETQATSAALVRARHEIERLSDMLVEAKLEAAKAGAAVIDDRGRIDALRVAQGVA